MTKQLTEAQKQRRRTIQKAYRERKKIKEAAKQKELDDYQADLQAQQDEWAAQEGLAYSESLAARTQVIPADQLSSHIQQDPEKFGAEIEEITAEQQEKLEEMGFPLDLVGYFESAQTILNHLHTQPVKRMTPRQRALLRNRRWRGEKRLSRAVAEMVLDTYKRR